jgi:hypothetical protein
LRSVKISAEWTIDKARTGALAFGVDRLYGGEAKMLDTSLLGSIARQMLAGDEVEIEGKRLPVRRTSRQGLRTVTFTTEGREYAAIEQNPTKPSRWGKLAREGHRVVQFKDVKTNRFVAVAVDGEAKEYGAMRPVSPDAKRD